MMSFFFLGGSAGHSSPPRLRPAGSDAPENRPIKARQHGTVSIALKSQVATGSNVGNSEKRSLTWNMLQSLTCSKDKYLNNG